MGGIGSRFAPAGKAAAVAALISVPAAAQDNARLERSLYDLQYRLGQIEGEMGKLRKASLPAPALKAIRSRADSLLPGLERRLDSLASRFAALETSIPGSGGPAGHPGDETRAERRIAQGSVPASKADGDSGAAAEMRALRGEIRALTALLTVAGARANPFPGSAPVSASASAGPAPASMPPAAGPILPPGLVLMGDIQIQGERRLANGSGQDNLDDFWGRLNIGAEYRSPGFQSKVNVRIFPEGFGFEPLTGAAFDTAGQGSLKTQTQPASKLLVNHAWARFAAGDFGLKVGRFETLESQSASYGNYIDQGPSGRFLARPAIHNAAEGAWAAGPWSSSLMLESGDRKLDRGSLRALQGFSGPGGSKASLGYRSNLFDRLRFPSAEILHRIDVGAVSPRFGGWQAFAEAAWMQTAGAADQAPVLAGVRPPHG